MESPLKGDAQQAHTNSSGLQSLYLPNRIQNRLIWFFLQPDPLWLDTSFVFSEVHSVHFISVSVLAAEQTVTDGSAPSSDFKGKRWSMKRCISSAVLHSVVCVLTGVFAQSLIALLLLYIRIYIQQLNQKDETVNMRIRPPGVRLSCSHLHLYRFLSLDPSFLPSFLPSFASTTVGR